MQFRNLLLSALTDSDRATLFPHLQEVTLRQGEVVHVIEQPVRAVYFPSSAVLSAVVVMRDGESIESATVGYEGVSGLLPALTGSKSPTRVFAQVAGAAVRLDAGRLLAAAVASSSLMQLLLKSVEVTSAQAEQSVACNALHDTHRRLVRWLLHTHDRVGSAVFPLTQEYMAIMVGVQRTTVSAVASELKAQGLIHYSRGVMEIRDRARLERHACECYRLLATRYHDAGLRGPQA